MISVALGQLGEGLDVDKDDGRVDGAAPSAGVGVDEVDVGVFDVGLDEVLVQDALDDAIDDRQRGVLEPVRAADDLVLAEPLVDQPFVDVDADQAHQRVGEPSEGVAEDAGAFDQRLARASRRRRSS